MRRRVEMTRVEYVMDREMGGNGRIMIASRKKYKVDKADKKNMKGKEVDLEMGDGKERILRAKGNRV
jgi:hypothetical protein